MKRFNSALSIGLYITFLALLAGCTNSGGGGRANDDSTTATIDNVSLFGVRIGMSPADINSHFPGAHCEPKSQHSKCNIPSTAMGSTGITVEFTNGRVAFARTSGSVNGGPSNVRRMIADQLGQAQGNKWRANGGVELAVSASSGDSAMPSDYVLTLTSSDWRLDKYRVDAAAARTREDAAVAHLATVLRNVVTINQEGRVALCGMHLGGKLAKQIPAPDATPPSSSADNDSVAPQDPRGDRLIRCSPRSKLMLSARYDCMTQLQPRSFPMFAPIPDDASMEETMEEVGRRAAIIDADKRDPFPQSDGCVNVNLSAAGKVRKVNVRLITFKPSRAVATGAIMSLDPTNKLTPSKPLVPGAITPPGYLDVTYSNNLGDALTIITKPDVSGTVVRLHGKPVSRARFR